MPIQSSQASLTPYQPKTHKPALRQYYFLHSYTYLFVCVIMQRVTLPLPSSLLHLLLPASQNLPGRATTARLSAARDGLDRALGRLRERGRSRSEQEAQTTTTSA